MEGREKSPFRQLCIISAHTRAKGAKKAPLSGKRRLHENGLFLLFPHDGNMHVFELLRLDGGRRVH